MADDKQTKLSIIIRTVDQATAKIKAINERLDEATKPTRDFKKALGELAEKSGLSSVTEGFKGVGEAVKESLFKLLEAGAIIGETVHLVLELCESFEALGKESARIGVTSDYLAGMRDAATRTGASVEDLDSGLEAFSVSLGKAKAGTGRMKAFIEKVSPALERQLEGAKSNAEAFDILAGAMAKLQDPAKKSALAAATVGEKLAPLFAKGPKGLKELRDHYLGLAGSQDEAVKSATEVGESMKDLHDVMDGIKAAIVEGLAPALKDVVDQLAKWLVGHREDIREWAKQLGEKIPDAVKKIVEWIGKAYDGVTSFLDAIGGVKNLLIGLAVIQLAPLVTSIFTLVGGLNTAARSAGLVGTSLAAWAGPILAAVAAADALNELTGGSIGEGLLDRARHQMRAEAYRPSTPAAAMMKQFNDLKQGIRPEDNVPDFSDALDNDLSGQARSALTGSDSASAKVHVQFDNMPRGTRVNVDPKSSDNIDLSTGQNFAGAL